MLKPRAFALFAFSALVALPLTSAAAPILFSGSGATPADIQATVDAFRAALGNPNNGNAPGPLPNGRREINWDGGSPTNDNTSPAGTPFNGFLNTRGASFTTPGTGFVQAPASGGAGGGLATVFGNATYGTIFVPFSPLRMFSPVGSNITDVQFFIPGTNGGTDALVSGFGAVFEDVDLPGVTTLEFFDAAAASLGSFSVPTANNGLSFLGVTFTEGAVIDRVRITTGNTAPGPNDTPADFVDIVMMDDFLYAEPQEANGGAPVPEPMTWMLLGAGLLGWLSGWRRRI
jgi:hypothetical protein